MGDGRPRPLLRIVYALVVGAIALGGLVTIVDWAQRGSELPGGGVPVTGQVVREEPGFAGALALVEVAYEAGGKERRARLPVKGSDEHPNDPTYRPGDTIALMVSRTDPERVQHANWDSGAPPRGVPGWVFAVVVAGVIAPLALPGPRRRLQEAISSFRWS